MDEENKVNEPVEPTTEPVVETPVEEPTVTPPPAEPQAQYTEPNQPKKKGNGGAIAIVIIVIVLLAAIGVLAYMLLNKDDEDSDKKSSKKENVTNSQAIEEDEEEDEDKDKDKEKDNKSSKEELEVVEEDGIDYLSDFSAFGLTMEDLKGLIETNMKDPDAKLKDKNGVYEVELKNGVDLEVTVNDDEYIEKIEFIAEIDEDEVSSEENEAYNMGVYFGNLLTALEVENMEDILAALSKASDFSDAKEVDTSKSYPQKAVENKETVNHLVLKAEGSYLSETKIEMRYSITPTK